MYALHYIKYKTLTYKYILLYIYLLTFFKLIVSFIFSIIFRFHACYFRECRNKHTCKTFMYVYELFF